MGKVQAIKAEIERRIKSCKTKNGFPAGTISAIRIETYEELLAFIDSLPEEDTTEDLNELIQKWDRIDINTILKVKVKASGKVIDGFYDGLGHFDHFIDHDVFDRYSIDEVELMPEEHFRDSTKMISKDLEEAAREWAEAHYKDSVSQKVCADDFIAGAEWAKANLQDREGK